MSAGREAPSLTSLGKHMEARSLELGLTWSAVARISEVDRETLRKMRFGLGGRRGFAPVTKRAVEDALQWQHGSIDTILAGEDPTPREPVEADRTESPLRTVAADAEPTFDEALEAYRKALQQLRRVATADPAVPAEVVDIVEDWDMMLTALQYGGVTAVRRALADSYKRRGDGDAPSQVG